MRLIDADKLMEVLEIADDCGDCPHHYYGFAFCQKSPDFVNACEAITNAPSIDAVPVIRCKDCKWYGRADKRRFYRGMDCLQKRIGSIVPERDFCSRAERKEE